MLLLLLLLLLLLDLIEVQLVGYDGRHAKSVAQGRHCHTQRTLVAHCEKRGLGGFCHHFTSLSLETMFIKGST